MDKEFLPYDLSLVMKEMGFDEECFARFLFNYKNKKIPVFILELSKNSENFSIKSQHCSAPLYQQAFKWFREKHNLFGYNQPDDYNVFNYIIMDLNWGEDKEVHFNCRMSDYKTPEEAELECLRKLISIVKTKKYV